MRKVLFLPILAFAALFLAGCSLPASTGTKTGAPKPNPNNSIWASFDGGKTWLNNFLPNAKRTDIASANILSMAVNPFDAKNVFAGTLGGGILKTDDGGNNWEYLKFQSEKVYGLDIDPLDGRIIYASAVWQNKGKIFKSTDSGTTWTEIYTAPSEGPFVVSLVIDKKNRNTVYVTTSDNQVLKTVDGGDSWKNIFASPMPIMRIVIDRDNNNLLYGITKSGEILRSWDGGQKFEKLSSQLNEAKIRGISILETDPVSSGWVYVGGQSGLFRSRNAGETWEEIKVLSNSKRFPVKALAINPANSREMVYGAAQAAYHSDDGGNTWETFQFDVNKSIKIFKYAAADPTNLYLGFLK